MKVSVGRFEKKHFSSILRKDLRGWRFQLEDKRRNIAVLGLKISKRIEASVAGLEKKYFNWRLRKP